MPELLALLDDFEGDKAKELVDTMASGLAGEELFATLRDVASAAREKYEDECAAHAMWIAFRAAASTDAEVFARELAKDLDRDWDEDGLAALHDELARRYANEPVTELRVRLGIADALDPWRQRRFAFDNLVAAEALAATPVERLAIVTRMLAHRRSLDADTRGGDRDADARTADRDALLQRCLALATELAGDALARDAVIRADLEIALNDPVLAHRHTTRAHELASATSDRDLRESAITALAELLLDADLLERADEVASQLEEGGALLEDIRRRRGVLPEPSVAEMTAPPAEAGNVDYFSKAELPDGLLEYFTRDKNPTTAIPRVVSPDKVREWSHGQIRTIADLESQKVFGPVRSFACGCGRFLGVKYRGVVCHRCGVEVIDRIARRYRTGHVVLPEPVAHPWHASTIAALLDIGVREAQNANARELHEQLRALHYQLIEVAERLRYDRPNDPRLAVMDAMTSSHVWPDWLVLEVLPVWPPESALRDRDAVVRAYADVLDGVDLRAAVTRLFSTIANQLNA